MQVMLVVLLTSHKSFHSAVEFSRCFINVNLCKFFQGLVPALVLKFPEFSVDLF